MSFFRKRRDEPADPEARSPKLGIRNKDLAVMGQLMKAGADLSQQREVIFFLYARDRNVATALAEEASLRGFVPEVGDPVPQYPDQWSVICRENAVVSPEYVRDSVDFFEGLAKRHQAEYDGWEAAVQPN